MSIFQNLTDPKLMSRSVCLWKYTVNVNVLFWQESTLSKCTWLTKGFSKCLTLRLVYVAIERSVVKYSKIMNRISLSLL